VGAPVTLEADSATFEDTVIDQKEVNTSLTVVGGEPTSSPQARIRRIAAFRRPCDGPWAA
jgi:hypothetical protein